MAGAASDSVANGAPDPTFNPAYRIARCGQGSTHGPHVIEHGPDQPRNCPGTAVPMHRHPSGRACADGKVLFEIPVALARGVLAELPRRSLAAGAR
jgi:hypothetical protein